MTNECGGFERAETWFMQVLEEFRIKDARLEAEVEVGRREREDRIYSDSIR